MPSRRNRNCLRAILIFTASLPVQALRLVNRLSKLGNIFSKDSAIKYRLWKDSRHFPSCLSDTLTNPSSSTKNTTVVSFTESAGDSVCSQKVTGGVACDQYPSSFSQ